MRFRERHGVIQYSQFGSDRCRRKVPHLFAERFRGIELRLKRVRELLFDKIHNIEG